MLSRQGGFREGAMMAIRHDIAKALGELAAKSVIHRGDLSRRFHQIKARGDTVASVVASGANAVGASRKWRARCGNAS